MTSSTLTGHQKRQQLLYIVLPLATAMIVLVIAITFIIISLLRPQLQYPKSITRPVPGSVKGIRQ